MTFEELAQIITKEPPKHTRRLIAVDGGGGAGKTTFANHLQKAIPNSYIVKVDDFYRPPQLRKPLLPTAIINPNFDWERLRSSVIEAIKNDNNVTYQLYDFEKGSLSQKTVEVPRHATVIVEGVWSMQSAFINSYDYCIWLEAPSEIRLERGLLRDGEGLRQVWENEWIPIDDAYKKSQEPHMKAQCVVDSVGSNFVENCIKVFN